MLTGINIPVRIGSVTVMPGDMVVGDPEGVYFVPPQLVQQIVDNADMVHIHDEWTRKKFDEGKYKSSEIYGSPARSGAEEGVRRVSQEAAGGDPERGQVR